MAVAVALVVVVVAAIAAVAAVVAVVVLVVMPGVGIQTCEKKMFVIVMRSLTLTPLPRQLARYMLGGACSHFLLVKSRPYRRHWIPQYSVSPLHTHPTHCTTKL